jgi:hypothetical protein
MTDKKNRIDRLEASVAAIHRMEISKADIKRNLERDPFWTSLSIDYVLDITDSLYLVDLEVSDIGIVEPILIETSQDNDQGQAPFAEKYFDRTGRIALEYENECNSFPSEDIEDRGHVRFYMHYFDPQIELKFGDKSLPLPAATLMPNWLRDLMPYKPPN